MKSFGAHPLLHSFTDTRRRDKKPHLFLWLRAVGTSDYVSEDRLQYGALQRGGSNCRSGKNGLILVQVWWKQIEWADVWGYVMVVAEAEVRLIWEQKKT